MLTSASDLQPIVTRRAHRRVSLRVDVELRLDGRPFEGTTGNVSEGGLYVVTAEPLPLGAVVDLALRLPGHAAAHQIRATVAWTAGGDVDRRGYGLRFACISGIAARELQIFIAASIPVASTSC